MARRRFQLFHIPKLLTAAVVSFPSGLQSAECRVQTLQVIYRTVSCQMSVLFLISPQSDSPNYGVPAGNDGVKHGSYFPANQISLGGADLHADYCNLPRWSTIVIYYHVILLLGIRISLPPYSLFLFLSSSSSIQLLLLFYQLTLLLPAFDFGHTLSLKLNTTTTTHSLN